MSEFVPEPVAPAPEPAAPEPAEPAWVGPSQEEWGSVMGYIQAQQQREAAYFEQQQQAQQQQAPGIDPFADDFGSQLRDFIRGEFQQASQPYQQFMEAQRRNEAEEVVLDIIDDDVSRNGDFLVPEQARTMVRALADVYYGEEVQRIGDPEKAVEAAVFRAAQTVREYEQGSGKTFHERQVNQYTRLGEAGREPDAAAAAVQQGSRVPNGGDELSVVTAFGGFPGRPT